MNKQYSIKNSTDYLSKYYPNQTFLNDLPEGLQPSIQSRYLNDVVGMFLKRFLNIYKDEPLSREDKEKMRHFLEKVIEAKDAVDPTEPEGGLYLRNFNK